MGISSVKRMELGKCLERRVLSKQVCEKCWNTTLKRKTGMPYGYPTDSLVKWYCAAYRGVVLARLDGIPPEKCSYKLEHGVSEALECINGK
jgi:hypothetical protein